MSLGAAHGTVCAIMSKRPAAPATASSSKPSLEGAPKIDVSLEDKNMVPYKYVEMLFKQVRPFQRV